MKLAGALVLLGAALLLTSGGDCDVCPDIAKEAHLFLNGNVSDFVNFIKQYNSHPLLLKVAKELKTCVNNKLTEDNKKHATALLVSLLTSSRSCAWAS
ncbi:major allergen I polypeptide chain 1-like [Acomys russatus]|uniref:major allergen I polypeptide chain 1-like n=1 Tax=Acomys russatus TaxID=60746 RepID=UPI0021E1C8B2|nr:major allergen I polypeptide chain 1-like [Acomys russatus]